MVPLTFSVASGADAGLFAINAVTGALSFLSAPDFEAPADADHNNVYDVIVRASDGTLFAEQEITVNVSNVAGLSLTGTGAANTLSGGGEEDTIIGLAGNDALSGAAGNDLIDGGAGADTLNGGDGNDTIIGGLGADIINGAAGNDVILYSIGDGGDTIVGDTGFDTLNISGSAGDDTLSVVLAGGAVTGVRRLVEHRRDGQCRPERRQQRSAELRCRHHGQYHGRSGGRYGHRLCRNRRR
jgi:Ca2+-binding RTX toxin-like protein